MKKSSLLFIGILLAGFAAKAQDPQFTQTYANPLYLNPAFAGTDTVQRIGVNFRDQWSGDYVTYGFSYDRNIIDSNLSIGILAYQDREGGTPPPIINTTASLVMGYQFHIKTFTLSAALKATYLQVNLNPSILHLAYQPNNRTSNADFSTGLLGYDKYCFFGFAIEHFTEPVESLMIGGGSQLQMKFTFNVGGMIPIGSMTLSPTLTCIKQGDAYMTVAELYLISKYVTAGLGYHFGDPWTTGNSLTFTLGLQYKQFRLGYSYDYTSLENWGPTNGILSTNEVSLALVLPYKSAKYKKTRGISYPHF